MRLVDFIFLSLLVGALNGCSTTRTREGDIALSGPACVAPQPDTFVTSAEWHPGVSEPLGKMDRLTSDTRLDGDLVITKKSVNFVPCSKVAGRNDLGIAVYPLEEIELAYRKDNWLFTRGYPYNKWGHRQYQGYYIHGQAQIAEAALAELLRYRPIETSPSIPTPSSLSSAKVMIVSQGDPEIRVAVVDREGIGKKVGEGATGAVGSIGPPTDLGGLILIPVVVPLVFIGGAVVGAAQSEIEAQRNAQLIVMDDAILNQAVQGLNLQDRFVREIEQRMQIVGDWNVVADRSTSSTHGAPYEDDALRGIVGAVELAPLRIELRTSKSDREKSPDEAEYDLSVIQEVRVYSTLSGYTVETINVIAGWGRHTLSEWREESGKRFIRAVSDAIKDIPDTIATNLPSALGKLIRFE